MKTTNIGTLLATAAVAVVISISTGRVSAEEKKAAAKPYPLNKCIVSDEKLGEMGQPFVFTHEGQEIKLCCKSCQKDFQKDPAKYLKKLAAAEKSDSKSDKK